MRHSQRHSSYAVSTVLGLAAPALAALLLTSSTPGLAAAAPTPLPTDRSSVLVHEAGAPISLPAPAAAAHHLAKTVAAPLVHGTVTVRHTAPRTVAVVTRPVASTPMMAAAKPVSQTAQPAGRDDYPFRSRSVDDYGFTARQCVSFVAWRLYEHNHSLGADGGATWGSAYNWDNVARARGYAITTRARVGEVAQWNAGESSLYYGPGSATANGHFVAGGYGHVGWVKAVYADGSALVEQYNMGDSQAYSVMRVKAPRYLVIG